MLAGRECHKINAVLQGLGEAARNVAAYDLAALAAAIDNPNMNATNFSCKRAALAPAPALAAAASAPPARSQASPTQPTVPSQQQQPQAPIQMQPPAATRLQPVVQQPTQSEIALTLPLRPIHPPFPLPSVAHIDPNDYISITQTLVGALITKPTMAAKHLEKPPFRFILDTVIAIERVRGHPAGLYSPDELNGDNYKPGAGGNKQAWLSKLIAYVATGLNEPSLVERISPRSIAAGVDPHLTNLLLQKFAILAASGIEPSHIIQVMNSGPAPTSGSRPTSAAPPSPPKPAQPQPQPQQPQQVETKFQQPEPLHVAPSVPVQQSVPPQYQQPQADVSVSASQGMYQQQPSQPQVHFTPNTNFGDSEAPLAPQPISLGAPAGVSPVGGANPAVSVSSSGLQRVATARRAPPRAPTATATAATGSASSSGSSGPAGRGKLASVIKEGVEIEEENEEGEIEQKQTTAPSLGPTDADGQLVRSIQKAMGAGQQDAGSGLKLGRVQTGRKANTIYSARQIQDLCAALQRICASVNPIGRCIEFAPGDIADMEKERVRWKNIADEQTAKLRQERALTAEMEQALEQKIAEAIRERDEQLQKVRRLRAIVLANEKEIAALLEQQVQ